MPINHGPDISTWNEVQNYLALPQLEFYATQVGVTARDDWRDKNMLVVDNQYRRNIDKFRELNFKRIIHYHVGINIPWKIQLDWLLKQMGPIPVNEGLMFDNEYGHIANLGWPSVKAMMDDAEQVLQRRVIHYGELFMKFDTERLKWAASYQNDRTVMRNRYPFKNVILWQFTRTGRLPGINANVDMNEILDFNLFNEAFGKKGSDDMYWQASPQGVATFRVGGGTAVWLDGSAGPPPELAGQVVQKVGLAPFKKLILVGPLPQGDSGRVWTKADFLAVIDGPIVIPPPVVIPGTVPKHTHIAKLVMEENT